MAILWKKHDQEWNLQTQGKGMTYPLSHGHPTVKVGVDFCIDKAQFCAMPLKVLSQ